MDNEKRCFAYRKFNTQPLKAKGLFFIMDSSACSVRDLLFSLTPTNSSRNPLEVEIRFPRALRSKSPQNESQRKTMPDTDAKGDIVVCVVLETVLRRCLYTDRPITNPSIKLPDAQDGNDNDDTLSLSLDFGKKIDRQ